MGIGMGSLDSSWYAFIRRVALGGGQPWIFGQSILFIETTQVLYSMRSNSNTAKTTTLPARNGLHSLTQQYEAPPTADCSQGLRLPDISPSISEVRSALNDLLTPVSFTVRSNQQRTGDERQHSSQQDQSTRSHEARHIVWCILLF